MNLSFLGEMFHSADSIILDSELDKPIEQSRKKNGERSFKSKGLTRYIL